MELKVQYLTGSLYGVPSDGENPIHGIESPDLALVIPAVRHRNPIHGIESRLGGPGTINIEVSIGIQYMELKEESTAS